MKTLSIQVMEILQSEITFNNKYFWNTNESGSRATPRAQVGCRAPSARQLLGEERHDPLHEEQVGQSRPRELQGLRTTGNIHPYGTRGILQKLTNLNQHLTTNNDI